MQLKDIIFQYLYFYSDIPLMEADAERLAEGLAQEIEDYKEEWLNNQG